MTEPIQVTVKQINGQSFKVTVNANTTNEQLIAATSAASGMEAKTIRLIHAGKDITEEKNTVAGMGLENGSTVFVVLRLEGGKWTG